MANHRKRKKALPKSCLQKRANYGRKLKPARQRVSPLQRKLRSKTRQQRYRGLFKKVTRQLIAFMWTLDEKKGLGWNLDLEQVENGSNSL
eukprot:scaffold7349_cov173-Amphora_coffeaeformis.AAC.72